MQLPRPSLIQFSSNHSHYIKHASSDSLLYINKDGKAFFTDSPTDAESSYLARLFYIKDPISDKSLVTIQSEEDIYLCSEPSGSLACNRSSLGPWETFELIPVVSNNLRLYQVRDYHGKPLFNGDLIEIKPKALGETDFPTNARISKHLDNSLSSTRSEVNLFPINFIKDIQAAKRRKRKLFFRIDPWNIPILASDVFHAVDCSMNKLRSYNISLCTDSWLKACRDSPINNGSPCILLLNNNNVHHTFGRDSYVRLYKNNPNCFIVVWDFDNHHWLSNSFVSAACSDYYVPAHNCNMDALSHISGHELCIMPCGVMQFRENDVLDRLKLNDYCNNKREIISGFHRFYPQFHFRNEIVRAFADCFPHSVGFTPKNTYNPKDYLANFEYWSSYALSLIAPVSGDIPIRFFDALMSGGMPLTPYYLTPELDRIGVPRDFYTSYDFCDLDNVSEFVEFAYQRYLKMGSCGIRERMLFASGNHHVNSRLGAIIHSVHSFMLSQR